MWPVWVPGRCRHCTFLRVLRRLPALDLKLGRPDLPSVPFATTRADFKFLRVNSAVSERGVSAGVGRPSGSLLSLSGPRLRHAGSRVYLRLPRHAVACRILGRSRTLGGGLSRYTRPPAAPARQARGQGLRQAIRASRAAAWPSWSGFGPSFGSARPQPGGVHARQRVPLACPLSGGTDSSAAGPLSATVHPGRPEWRAAPRGVASSWGAPASWKPLLGRWSWGWRVAGLVWTIGGPGGAGRQG